MGSRLLLLACSQQKRPDVGLLPAIERYDGPAYKVLRRYMQTHPHDVPDLFILSARFGLIRGDVSIPAYDLRMTPQRANELRESTAARVQALATGQRYQLVFLYGGMLYRRLLLSTDLDALTRGQASASEGTRGMQLTLLKSWLYRDAAPPPASPTNHLCSSVPIQFTLKGRTYKASHADILEVVRRAAQSGILGSATLAAWHILIDGHQIAPKWLVSQLTGVPVSQFHSEAARRVLVQFGLVARHI